MPSYLIGLGNPAMSDDGIGPRLVEDLADRGLPPGVTPIVLGQDGLALFAYFETDIEQIVIVDAVRMGGEPGAWRWFSPEEVETVKPAGRASAHEGDLLSVLELARQLDYSMPPMLVLGIEPARLEPGFALSEVLEAHFAEYATACLRGIQGPFPGDVRIEPPSRT